MSNELLESYFDAVYQRIGTLDLDFIHDEVANPTNPLHDRYEWDDAKAGREFRKQQIARDIRTIERVYVDDSGQAESARAYLANREIGKGRRGYTDSRAALQDPETLKHLELSMELEIRSLHRRYHHLESYAAVIQREADEARKAAPKPKPRSSGGPRITTRKPRRPAKS